MFAFNNSERKEFEYNDYLITVNFLAFSDVLFLHLLPGLSFLFCFFASLRLSLAGIDGKLKTTLRNFTNLATML